MEPILSSAIANWQQFAGGTSLVLAGGLLSYATAWGVRSFGTGYQRTVGSPSAGNTTIWFIAAVGSLAVGVDVLATGGQNTGHVLAAFARTFARSC